MRRCWQEEPPALAPTTATPMRAWSQSFETLHMRLHSRAPVVQGWGTGGLLIPLEPPSPPGQLKAEVSMPSLPCCPSPAWVLPTLPAVFLNSSLAQPVTSLGHASKPVLTKFPLPECLPIPLGILTHPSRPQFQCPHLSEVIPMHHPLSCPQVPFRRLLPGPIPSPQSGPGKPGPSGQNRMQMCILWLAQHFS